MCVQKRPSSLETSIYIGNERPSEHRTFSIMEIHGSVTLLFMSSREPISDGELYHQVGGCDMNQIVIRQSLLDAVSVPEGTVITQFTSGYVFGRTTEDGGVIVDGFVFAEDKEPGLLRLDPKRTLEGILKDSMHRLDVKLIGTFSYADYVDGNITEKGLVEKVTDLPHIYLLSRGGLSFNEVAVITPKQGGYEVHNGIGIVEHGRSIEWGLVNSVRSISAPVVEIKLL